MIFVITGPSGCGKTTLIKRLLKRMKDVQFSVSHTTRPKRDSEREGRDYYFVSKPEFEKMIKGDKLLEWAEIHGNYYGTSRREVGMKSSKGDLILDIDVHGARNIKSKLKKAVFIFVLPPSFHELRRRLEDRGDERADAIKKRLELARKEIRSYPMFNYIIINDKLDHALKELEAIILSSRCCLNCRRKEIMPILRSFSEEE
jgi:guanylate kinase